MPNDKIAAVHPGAYLRELLDELGISQYKFSKDLGVPAMRVITLSKGGARLGQSLPFGWAATLGKTPDTI